MNILRQSEIFILVRCHQRLQIGRVFSAPYGNIVADMVSIPGMETRPASAAEYGYIHKKASDTINLYLL